MESRCWQCWFLLEALRENLLPCVCQFPETSYIPRRAPFLHLLPNLLTSTTSLTLWSFALTSHLLRSHKASLAPLSYKEACDYIGLTWIMSQLKIPNLITSPGLCKSVHSQAPGIKMWPSRGSDRHHFAYHTRIISVFLIDESHGILWSLFIPYTVFVGVDTCLLLFA